MADPNYDDGIFAYVDCETTGRFKPHVPFEVCMWREDEPEPVVLTTPHTLDSAEPDALRINRYFERGFLPGVHDEYADVWIARALTDVTLVAANARFDADMVAKIVGYEPWHYRLLDIEAYALGVIGVRMGWRRPRGMKDITLALRDMGFEIPEPDHTAEADVRALRAAHEALLVIATKEGAR